MIDGLLRKRIDFKFVKRLYAKPIIQASDSLEEIRQEYSLWEAYILPEQPPIVIVDNDGYVRPQKLSYSLAPLSDDELAKIQSELPESVKKQIERILADYGQGN